MTCYHPIQAWKRVGHLNENGKAVIVFNRKEINGPVQEVQLPCGQCIGCRVKKSREWALRCVHESSLYDRNCFITLTFNEEYINGKRMDINGNVKKLYPGGTLIKADFQRFIKRLRKRFKGYNAVENKKGEVKYPIRYFHCGEYGEKMNRPHHHACIFNFDFEDKKLWVKRDGVELYRSEELEKLWPYGYCTIGAVTFKSAAYVARYVIKKISGKLAKDHYRRVDPETGEVIDLVPEYITMSRRPGIGMKWYERYSDEVFNKDFVTNNGSRIRVPSYYDKLLGEVDPEMLSQIKKERSKGVRRESLQRLSVISKVKSAKIKSLKRSL